MKDTMTVGWKKLEIYVAEVVATFGLSKEHSIDVAERLVKAHLRGFDTHGLPCLFGYVEALEEGRINSTPLLTVEKSGLCTKKLDGDNGLGQVAGTQAMKMCLESAASSGIGCVTVKRSNHFGAASTYSLMALERNCIGIVMSNAASVTAPFGAAEPLLGTNPMSVAIPAGEAAPFVIDMATSEGSRKKVRKALEDNKKIPAGWSLDKNGEPTTDPAAALEGVMLPFGGMKGSAITILTDILSGVLSGAEFGGQVLSVATNHERESGNGNFMLAINVEMFMPVEKFHERMDEELSRIMNLKPANGFNRVIYPGFLEHETEQKRLREGILLDGKLLEKMQVLGTKMGVALPV
jgi:L-2-hydroxycarboxylate dehydrogenase (NAD+)